MAAKLRKGDEVIVLAGKDKGKKGTISSLDPKANKAVVDGVNMAIRHTRQSQTSQGGRVRRGWPSRSLSRGSGSKLRVICPSLVMKRTRERGNGSGSAKSAGGEGWADRGDCALPDTRGHPQAWPEHIGSQAQWSAEDHRVKPEDDALSEPQPSSPASAAISRRDFRARSVADLS